MKLTILTPLLTAAILLSAASNAQALLIDSFDTPHLASSSSGTTVSSAPAPEALGGNRDIINSSGMGTGPNSLVVGQPFGPMAGVGTPGALDYTEANRDGVFVVQYDGVDSTAMLNTTGLGSENLSIGGLAYQIVLRDVTVSGTDADISLDIYSDGGANSATVSRTLADGFSGDVFFLLSDFGGVDFTGISAIQLRGDDGGSDSGTNSFFEVSAIEVITPEPSSIALLGMGALSLVGYGWRRKKRLVA